MFYGKIENNILIQKQTKKEKGFVEIPEDAVCGQILVDGKFVNPDPVFDFKDEVKTLRREKENSGIELNGVKIETDLASRTNILGASQLGTQINWKTQNGFVQLTTDQVKSIALAVGAHVQRCFDCEKELTAQHEEQPFTNKDDLQVAFEAKYTELS